MGHLKATGPTPEQNLQQENCPFSPPTAASETWNFGHGKKQFLKWPFYPFLGEGSPTKLEQQESWHPYSNLTGGLSLGCYLLRPPFSGASCAIRVMTQAKPEFQWPVDSL